MTDPAEGGLRVGVEVVNETAVPIDEEAAARAVMFVLEREDVSSGEVALAFVEEAAMAELNSTYRSLDEATDVLSFPGGPDDDFDWPEPEEGLAPHLGDIVICPTVAQRNAAEDGVPLAEELRRLVVHGTLHLLDYDHEVDQGEQRARETELLGDPTWDAAPLVATQ